MLNLATRLSIVLLAALIGVGCDARSDAKDLYRLVPASCVTLSASGIAVALDVTWNPYLPATRACPLMRADSQPEVFLVSIFAEDYYRDKPNGAAWENFPKPILVNSKGGRIGEIGELFPYDLPGEMLLTYGSWLGDIPGMISVHVSHPAVGGDYDLPTLQWDRKQNRYVPQDAPVFGDFQMLVSETCRPLAPSVSKIALGVEWKPYLSAIRVCPLARPRGARPDIELVTIFADDFYRAKPGATNREAFPRPLLVNRNGERVGALNALFPYDDSGEMFLSYGAWQDHRPGKLVILIFDRESGRGMSQSTLVWNQKDRSYAVPIQ